MFREEKMRIDILLNKLCLVKSRNIAKNLCDKDLVKINDEYVKASTGVNEGDIIEYSVYGYKTVIELLSVPKGNVAKKNSGEYYQIIRREKLP